MEREMALDFLKQLGGFIRPRGDTTIISLCPDARPGSTHPTSSCLPFARGSLKSSARLSTGPR